MSWALTFAQKRTAPLLTSVGGFALTSALFFLGNMIVKAWSQSDSSVVLSLLSGMGIVLLVLFPVVSIAGLVVGITYLRKNGKDGVAILGVVVNACWLAFFTIAFFVMFVLGATA